MISLSHTLDTRWCMIASKLRQAWVFLLHSDGGCCFSKAGVPFVIDIRDSPSKSPSYGQRFSSILSFTNSDNPRATCVAKGPEYLSRSRKKFLWAEELSWNARFIPAEWEVSPTRRKFFLWTRHPANRTDLASENKK